MDQKNKADAGKSNPILLEVGCAHALAAVARVLDYGAEKYEPNSWREVESARYNAAARRHRIARDMGETRDVESGLLHLAHEAANILFQLELLIQRDGVDFTSYKAPPTDHRT